jgi:predicted Zn-dependent protease
MKATFTKIIAAVLPWLLLAGCAQNPVTGANNFVTVSEPQEIQIGQQEDAKVRDEYGVYNNAVLQQYVDAVGQSLARNSHRPGLEYHFTVVDSPEINAFALPGGYVYITRGILAYLNSEAELAGVLGHEIGHVTARHSVQQMSASQVAGVGSTLLQILVPQLRNEAGSTAINAFGSALLSGYGREHELQADQLGAEYLYRTGYDPQAMIRVIGALKNQELFDAEIAQAEGRQPQAYHGLFASHPDNDTRLQQVVAAAGGTAPGHERINREAFLHNIDKLLFGDSPAQGIVKKNNFYHTDLGLALTLPEGWKITNARDQVSAIAPGGDAIVALRTLGPAQGTPVNMLQQFLKGTNVGIESSTTAHALPAATARISAQGTPTVATVVFFGNSAYLIAAQAQSAQALRGAETSLAATVNSLRTLSASERKLAQPLKLRVITAKRSTTFAELARSSPLGNNAASQLRLLNGLYPNGEPIAGQPLKIVE